MDRILLVMTADAAEDCCETLQSALERAASDRRVSIGLLIREEPGEAALEYLRKLGTVQYMKPTARVSADILALWQGEGYVLLTENRVSFTKNWDMQLLKALRECSGGDDPKRALTGALPTPLDAVDAVYPLAADHFDEQGTLWLRRGIPLRYSVKPLRTPFLNPGFSFAPVGFWRDLAEEEADVGFFAHDRGWQLYTLHRAVLRAETARELPVLPKEHWVNEAQPEAGGLLSGDHLSVSARTGIPSSDGTFLRSVPAAVKLQQALRRRTRGRETLQPLLVTRFAGQTGEDGDSPSEDMVYFRLLSAVETMPLLCFADARLLRVLTPVMPNALEDKPRYRMPLSLISAEDERKLPVLNKLQLLNVAREKQLNHTHYIWVSRSVLRYPVYEHICPDWNEICTDKAVLATVDGEPDTAMIAVPEHLVADLGRECLERCRDSLARTGKLPEENVLWRELLRERQDIIAPVPLPRPGMLIDLTMQGRGEELMTEA